MEVRSDPSMIPNRDSFTISVQKSPATSPTPAAQSIRMPYSSDGPPAFRPASSSASYQVGGAELPAAQIMAVNTGESVKRKRGRPRKYAGDGKPAVGKSAAPLSSPASTGFSLSYTSSATPRSRGSSSLLLGNMKKSKGRASGYGKKLQMDGLGLGGIGFTPHVITVKAGEDVSSKIMSFSHHGPRAVCILSANGAISNVTLRQAATSGGTVTYEGRFEILSLSGSFLLSESDGQRSRTGGLSVSLAGSDGRVLGGGVAGLLTAASPVQVVVGSFIADGGRKEPEHTIPADIASAPVKPAPVGLPNPLSPASQGTVSESSGGGPGSPANRSANGNNNQQQSLANMPWK
ncbi:AT-hook motif nuclear-localized protein 10-like [Phalaenopsis equestris]|uniref:AT-hook motif nuclear-localized protein 10-like n=1 Tax=Phalaenopsis equestris TaxID=78828 RepID=UPI0009E1BEE8|nr:AT-hook motif nuclear-localized protein 10-like [Phalaenopsis equestris]